MTCPARIRKKILAGLEDNTYSEVAVRRRVSPNTPATREKRPQSKDSRRSTPPAFPQKRASGKTLPLTLMTVNRKKLP